MNAIEIIGIYAGGGFLNGRYWAGIAHQSGVEALEEWQKKADEWNKRKRPFEDEYGAYYDQDDKPSPSGRALAAFLGSFVFWPIMTVGFSIDKAIRGTPNGVWHGLKWVFVKPPPKRLRKEKRLAELQRKTTELERELEL